MDFKNELRFLITTWGNPNQWKNARYKYKDKEEEAKTTLKILSEIEQFNKIFIICLDSLATETYKDKNEEKYDHIKKSVEEFIKGKLNEFEIKNQNIEIIVCSGGGKHRARNDNFEVEIKGSMSDFYYELIYELSKRIINEIKEPNKKHLKFYLDITLGINFVPTLTYKALRTILEILAYRFEVEFYILNSEPFLEERQLIEIQEIERTKVMPKVIVYKPSDCYLSQFKREFAFASSFIHALVIWTLYFMPNFQELNRKIQEIYEFFHKNIEVKKSQNKLEIIRREKISFDFENLIKIYLMAFIVKDYSKLKKADKRSFDVGNLKKFSSTIWGKINYQNYIIQNEFEKLERGKTKLDLRDSFGNDEKDKRHLIAHAGFEGRLITGNKEMLVIKDKVKEDYFIDLLPEQNK